MELTFLGTGCMMPTRKRATGSVLLSYGSEGILFDCGEGTQRQFRIAKIKPTKITKILLSHWHGDHVLGLPGLLQTLGAESYNKKIDVYGPKGTKEFMKHMFKSFIFDLKIDLKIIEVDGGKFFENEDFYLKAEELKHSAKILGFSFVEKDKRRINLDFVKKLKIPDGPLLGKLQKNKEIIWKNKKIKPKQATTTIKGKKITYITDTSFCNSCIKLAEGSDILITEAVFTKEFKDKAKEYKHLTAEDAAIVAKKSNSKRLILTNFSQRHETTTILEKEAKNLFKNTECVEDFSKITKI